MKTTIPFAQPVSTKNRRFIYFIFAGLLGSFIVFIIANVTSISPLIFPSLQVDYRRRPGCTCSRSELSPIASSLTAEPNESRSSLCSLYATRRGPNQRIIAISLFGPNKIKGFSLIKR